MKIILLPVRLGMKRHREHITPHLTFCSGLNETGFDLASAEVRDRTDAVKVRVVLLSY